MTRGGGDGSSVDPHALAASARTSYARTSYARLTVDDGGRVERVELGAQALRYDAAELSAEITATIRRAQTRAADRLRESMRDVLGADAPDYPLD